MLVVVTDAVDPEGEAVDIALTWTRDAVTQTGLADALTVPSALTTRDEVWAVTVQAFDPAGNASAEVTASTTIANSPPSVTASLPAAPTVDTDLVLTAPTTDLDGDPVSLTVRWTVDQVAVPSLDNALTVPASQLAPGAAWRAVVTPDDGDLAGTAQIVSATIVDRLPTITDVSVTPTAPTIADTLTATATAVDPDGTPVTLSWTWSDVTVLPPVPIPSATTDTLTLAGFSKGDQLVAFASALGVSPLGSNVVTVRNSPPAVDGARIEPTTATAGTALTCVPGALSDPDGDEVTADIVWLAFPPPPAMPVAPTEVGTGGTLPANTLVRGQTVSCRVTPRDTDDATGTPATSASVVISNSPPEAGRVILAATVPLVDVNTTHALTCAIDPLDPGTDPDGDPVTYTYAWQVGARAFTGQVLPARTAARGEVVTCTATPNDGTVDGTPRTSEPLPIGNALPILEGATITPDSPTALDALGCAASGAEDPDGDDVTVTYAWTVTPASGPPRDAGTGPTLPAGTAVRGEVVTCTATPADDVGPGAPAQAQTPPFANSAPKVASVRIEPETLTVTSTPVCVAVGASDPDGDPLIAPSVTWFVDDVGKASLGATDVRKGRRLRCALRPSDGDLQGAEVVSDEVTVVDTPGEVTGVRITPDAPMSSDVLQCVGATYVDPDPEDATTLFDVRWLDDTGAQIATGNSLAPAQHARGDQVRCEATARGLGVSAQTELVPIGNTPPDLRAISIDSPSESALDPLTAFVGLVIDPDGDTLTYTWTWALSDGTPLGEGETLSPGGYAKGDVVVLTGVANDGFDDSAPATATLTIRNAPPDPVTAVWSTTTPVRHADDLVCEVPSAAPPKDADDDAVTYRVQWSTNGASWADTPASPNPDQYATTALPFDTLRRDWPALGTTSWCRLVARDADGAETPGPGISVDWTDGPWIFEVDSTDDAPQANPGSFNTRCADALGRCTLRAAFMAAGSVSLAIDPLGSVIILQPGATYGISLPDQGNDLANPQYGTIDIRKRFELVGDATSPPTIVPTAGGIWISALFTDAPWTAVIAGVDFEDAPGRVLVAQDGVDIALTDVAIRDSNEPLLVSGGHVDAVRVTISGNAASGTGTGILLNLGATGTFTDLTVTDRVGAMTLLQTGLVTLDGPTFQRNETTGSGGDILVSSTVGTSQLVVRDGLFEDSLAANDGGSIHLQNGGSVELIDSVIRGATAGFDGGCISSANPSFTPTITLRNTTLTECSATDGGGLNLLTGSLVIGQGSRIENNVASGNLGRGGGMYLFNPSIVAADSVVTGNEAEEGGGIYHLGTTVIPAGLTVSGNTPDDIVDGDGP